MKAIKFRAWHKAQKKMYSAERMGRDQLTLMTDDRGFVNIHGKDTKLSKFYVEMIPLQFIGLHDKNGKEIYEGDWVEASIYGDEVPQVLEVEYRNTCFVIDYEDSESDCVPVGHFVGNLKIIGNIYENPEL